jgi:hypothetical protein
MNATVADRRSVVRLTACPQCSDRRRVLVESATGLRGHCFNCGRTLNAPLATERSAGPVQATHRAHAVDGVGDGVGVDLVGQLQAERHRLS